MNEVTVVEEVPEVVVSLAASLEAPETEEVVEVVETAKVETKVDEAAETVAEKIDEAKAAGATTEELNELRGLLRELRNDNISLKARLSAAERVQKGDFGTEGKEVEKSELEAAQERYQAAASRNFDDLIALMEVNPKFEDLAEVCSESNFADIFEAVASNRSKQAGTDFSTELVKVMAEVWEKPNPYKYMYGIIKEHHPKYKVAEKEPAKEPDKKVSAKEIVAKKPVTAPGSVANLGGGSEGKGGWTSERIDNMPENQLHTVPKDIYKKWLEGDLE